MIVIFEQSAGIFHEIPDHYIHYGKTIFNTGLKLELLQEYCLVTLDVFKRFPYAKERSEQTAWLSLLATENLEDAEKLVQEYPWLEEIYEEMAMLRQNPEEVLGMFSEALRILDRNTVKYMIEDLQKEVEEEKKRTEEERKKADAVIEEKNRLLEKQNAEIEELRRQLKQQSEEKKI